MDDDHARIRRHILKKLYAYGAFRHGHLLRERLLEGVPGHLRGEAKTALAQLCTDGLVRRYAKTKHGDAYQLDIEKLSEIERELFGKE
jgi:hypothetical protein